MAAAHQRELDLILDVLGFDARALFTGSPSDVSSPAQPVGLSCPLQTAVTDVLLALFTHSVENTAHQAR